MDPTTKEKLVHTYIHVCTYSVVMEMFCETKATHRMKCVRMTKGMAICTKKLGTINFNFLRNKVVVGLYH